jgi:hypothetical protein
MGIRLGHYVTHKEKELTATILGCRISEAGLDIVFICFPQAIKAIPWLSWLKILPWNSWLEKILPWNSWLRKIHPWISWLRKNDGAIGKNFSSFSTAGKLPPQTPGPWESGQELESQKSFDGSTKNILRWECEEDEGGLT